MKTLKKMLMIVAISGMVITSCKKEDAANSPTTQADVAGLVAGDYTGSGVSDDGNFVNQKVSVVKVSNTRIKVQPGIGNTHIKAFEINIMKIGDKVTQDVNEENNSLGLSLTANPVTLSFSTDSPTQDFGGFKQ